MVDSPRSGAARDAADAPRRARRVRIEGRDLEDVDARRVERAELVRSIRDRRAADSAAGEGGHVEAAAPVEAHDRAELATGAAGGELVDTAPLPIISDEAAAAHRAAKESAAERAAQRAADGAPDGVADAADAPEAADAADAGNAMDAPAEPADREVALTTVAAPAGDPELEALLAAAPPAAQAPGAGAVTDDVTAADGPAQSDAPAEVVEAAALVTEGAESDAPAWDALESDAPDSDAPDSDGSESDAPESDAPESEGPVADEPQAPAPAADASEWPEPTATARDGAEAEPPLVADPGSEPLAEDGVLPTDEAAPSPHGADDADDAEAAPSPDRAESDHDRVVAVDPDRDHDQDHDDEAAPPTVAIPILAEEPIRRDADDAVAPALARLAAWRRDADERQRVIDAEVTAARGPRRRDQADPAGDLERALRDPDGERFLVDLLDDVIRPDDSIARGNGLGDLASRPPAQLRRRTRRALQIGAIVGPGLPWVAVRALERTTRGIFGGEVLVDGQDLDAALAEARAELGRTAAAATGAAAATQTGAAETPAGAAASARPFWIRARAIGARILGEEGAAERLRRLAALAEAPSIDELDLDLAELEPALDLWDMDGAVDRIAGRIAPIAHLAMTASSSGSASAGSGGPSAAAAPAPADGGRGAIMLRASRGDELELAVRVLQRLLEQPELRQARLGIALPAAFPETASLVRRVVGLAHLRREDLGAPLTIAVTRDGSIGAERIAAAGHGWRLASFASDAEVDASLARLLDRLLVADDASAIRVELDSSRWRDQALAVALAEARQLPWPVRIAVPWGEREDAVRRLGVEPRAELILRAPIAPDASLRAAVPWLVQRVRAVRAGHAGDERTAILPRQAQDRVHPDDALLLDAVARRGSLPSQPFRSQERVDADQAATVTAGIELELFPPEMFADDDGGSERIRASGGLEAGLAGAGPSSGPSSGPSLGTSAGAASGSRSAANAASASDAPGAPARVGDPDESGPLPGLTQVVLGLRRGRILRNTFRHAPSTDPSIAANREWGARIQRRVARSEIGTAEADRHLVGSPERIEELLAGAKAAAGEWGAKPGWERAAVLEKAAKALEANRARLVEAIMSESGTPLGEVDHEISRVVDFANHCAHLARQLDRMQGATFQPVGISLVVPSGSGNLSASAASCFGGLGAGSAVILNPEPIVRRAHAVFARVLWDAGIAEELVQLAVCDDGRFSDEQLAQELVTDRRVERLLFTGEREGARDLLRWRTDLPIIGGASGKNAMIVAPSADLEAAVWDALRSAAVATGQTPGHLSTIILVGSVARSPRFLELLADAVTSVRVGYPSDPSANVGPLAKPADGQARWALRDLGEGETWLVEPRQLDDTGRLWTPGVRLGVQPGSFIHTTGFQGPHIGVMTALTLDEAIRIQNATSYGLSAGIHSRDRTEIAEWIRTVEAGNLYVNRDLLGNEVQRMPFGGWKRSNIGTRYKSGGPNQLISLGSWRPDDGEQSQTLHLRGLDGRAGALIEAAQPHIPYETFDIVRRSALSDQIAWNEEFGETSDITNLPFERNLLRYVPVPVSIRVQEGASLADLVRILIASQIARSKRIDLSTGIEVPAEVRAALAGWDIRVRDETDEEHLARLRDGGADALRIRLVGGGRGAVCQALGADADASVWSDPVTMAGRVELLPFLREQSISLAAHRYGEPEDLVAELFPHEKLVDRSAPVTDPGNPVL